MKFKLGLQILGIQFPELLKQKEKIKLMQDLLSDLSEEEFVRGVKTLILRHKEIFPNTNIIAVIRDYALTEPSELSPEHAWAYVMKYRKDRKLPLPDLILESMEAVGHWACIVPGDEEDITRAHFLRIYRSLQDAKKAESIMGSL